MSVLSVVGNVGDVTDAVLATHKAWIVVTHANIGGTSHIAEVYTHSPATRCLSLSHKYEVQTPTKAYCLTLTSSYVVFGTAAGEVCFHSLVSGEGVSVYSAPSPPDAVVAMCLSHPSHTNIVVAFASCRVVLFHGHVPHHAVCLCGVGAISDVIASSAPVLPSVVSVLERTGEEGITIVTAGAPYLSCFQNLRPASARTGATTNLMAVTNVIASSAVTMVRKFWGSSAETPRPPPQAPVIETPQAAPYSTLTDAGRFGDRIVPDPSHRFAAVSDKFGRVTLLDLRMFLVMDILKGYREAHMGWGRGRGGGAVLIVYLPWRGVLEVFAVEGTRFVKRLAEDVGMGLTLLANGIVVRPGGEIATLTLDDSFEERCGVKTDRHAQCAAAYEHTTSKDLPLDTFASLCDSIATADSLDRIEFCECLFSHSHGVRCSVFTEVVAVGTLVSLFFEYIRSPNALWATHVEPHIPCLTDILRGLPPDELLKFVEGLSLCQGEAAAQSACVLHRCGVRPPDGLLRRAIGTTAQFMCDRYQPLGLEELCPRSSPEYAYYRLMGQCDRRERIKSDSYLNSKPFFRHAILCGLWRHRHVPGVVVTLRALVSEYKKVTADPSADFTMALLLEDHDYRATAAHALTMPSGPKSMRRIDMYLRIADVCSADESLVPVMDAAFAGEVVHAFDVEWDSTAVAPLDAEALRTARRAVVTLAASAGAVTTVQEALEVSAMLEIDNADCALEFFLRQYLTATAEPETSRVDDVAAKMSDKRIAATMIADIVRMRICQHLNAEAQSTGALTGKKKALATQRQADHVSTMSFEFHDWVFREDGVRTLSPPTAATVTTVAALIPMALRYGSADTPQCRMLLEATDFLRKCAETANPK